jgi:hypothetical protein
MDRVRPVQDVLDKEKVLVLPQDQRNPWPMDLDAGAALATGK